MAERAVVLVNLGTPDSYSVADVRKYLREFLMDGRVIDKPFIFRWMLVNLIIAPFRAPKSAKVYKTVWLLEGSPLKVYGIGLQRALQQKFGDSLHIELAMRYQSPGMDEVFGRLEKYQFKEILVVPLFPQYASASTGSVLDKAMEITRKWQLIPELKMVSYFFDSPEFLDAWKAIAAPQMHEKYDHVLFSYHGLPEGQIKNGDPINHCLKDGCCDTWGDKNRYCYRAQCFETSRRLADLLDIPADKYTVSFQSRLGKEPWIKPYSDDIIKELPKMGHKNVIAFSPSFVADCLETTEEVGEEYKELFEKSGGKHWQLIESLNVNEAWVDGMQRMITRWLGLN
jgi:ferrochelatase